jgi:hypothetical protein
VPKTTVSYEALERDTNTPIEIHRAQLGLKIVWGLLALVVLVLLLVSLFAWLTYPHAADYQGQAASVGGAVDEARRTWFDDIKDLLELLVVSLIVPLVATVIGYIFGRQVEASSPES